MPRGGPNKTLTCQYCGKEITAPGGLVKNSLMRHEATCQKNSNKPEPRKKNAGEKLPDEKGDEIIADDNKEEEPTLVHDEDGDESQVLEFDDEQEEEKFVCSACQTKVSKNDVQCPSCGEPLNWEAI